MPKFRKLAEKEVWRGRMISVAIGSFEAPDGHRFERDIVHHPGAVIVVPVIDEGESVLLVRQYRAAIDTELLEVPAGKRDKPGEAPEATARRELIADGVITDAKTIIGLTLARQHLRG